MRNTPESPNQIQLTSFQKTTVPGLFSKFQPFEFHKTAQEILRKSSESIDHTKYSKLYVQNGDYCTSCGRPQRTRKKLLEINNATECFPNITYIGLSPKLVDHFIPKVSPSNIGKQTRFAQSPFPPKVKTDIPIGLRSPIELVLSNK